MESFTQFQLKSCLTFLSSNIIQIQMIGDTLKLMFQVESLVKEKSRMWLLFLCSFSPYILSFHSMLSVFLTTDHSLSSLHFVRRLR